MLRVILLAFALTLSAVPVEADTWDDAVAAHARGDYAEAMRLWRPLAEQGHARAQYRPPHHHRVSPHTQAAATHAASAGINSGLKAEGFRRSHGRQAQTAI
jgi:hypothetical protein